MTDLEQRIHEAEARERAISTFLYLGDKLRALYTRGKTRPDRVPPVPKEGAEALLRAIEGEIIPRLMLAHQADELARAPKSDKPATITVEDRAQFLSIVLTDSAAGTRLFVEQLVERGVTREAIFLDLLSSTARRLGELWEEDEVDFSAVTVGLCRLHQVLREHSVLYENEYTRLPSDGPRILLTTAAADQHVLGVVMVAEFFRRAGWRVWSEPGSRRSQLEQLLQDESFDVLGLSAACSALAEQVADEIGAYRRASCNSDLKILVGGRLFAESPELVAEMEVDGVSLDAKAAPATARELLARPQIRY